jgi:PAS domain S-box-containing protein
VLDITEQRRADEALRGSEERLRQVFDASTDGYWERDLVTGKVLHSARLNEIVGRPAMDTVAVSDDWLGRTHPDDRRELAAAYERVLAGDEARFDRTFRTVHADGTWRWVRSRGKVAARDPTGRALLVSGTITDIHEGMVAQEALALAHSSAMESEERYRNLINHLQAGIVVHAPDTSIVLSNETASKILGLTSDQMQGKEAMDLAWRFLREDGSEMPFAEFPVNQVARTHSAVANQVVGMDRPATGDRAWALVNAYPTFRGPGDLLSIVVTFVDITRLKAAEQDLRESQTRLALASRLAAMGTLVAGVAHEINNPLAAELSNQGLALELARDARMRRQLGTPMALEEELRLLDEAIEALEDAQEGGQRVARIVRDMAAFASPDPRRTRSRLADVVDAAMRWLPASVAQAVTVSVEHRDAPDIMASSGQVEQVIVNLITNAAKAAPVGKHGEILVRTGPGAQGMARLEVIDQGTGIEPGILDRIFEPFFTTRRTGEGRGSGLGLAVCHAIATSHGGTLTVESEVGKGSTFRMELPAVPAEA